MSQPKTHRPACPADHSDAQEALTRREAFQKAGRYASFTGPVMLSLLVAKAPTGSGWEVGRNSSQKPAGRAASKHKA
ncbi:MAG: hypothetical protein KQJ78_03715 [Deltaproteobacteria bacterium]|nr:hypothetical protein [Deltaproteobacteria bacterium]